MSTALNRRIAALEAATNDGKASEAAQRHGKLFNEWLRLVSADDLDRLLGIGDKYGPGGHLSAEDEAFVLSLDTKYGPRPRMDAQEP